MPHKIIDTNVPLTAAGNNDAADAACQLACVQIVKRIFEGDIVIVLDEDGETYKEYRNNMYPDPKGSLAGQFLMYFINCQYDLTRSCRVKLERKADGEYEDFPNDDEALLKFDLDDRKWVAMARRFKKDTQKDAPIVNAADRDWRIFRSQLEKWGVQLEFLCQTKPRPAPNS